MFLSRSLTFVPSGTGLGTPQGLRPRCQGLRESHQATPLGPAQRRPALGCERGCPPGPGGIIWLLKQEPCRCLSVQDTPATVQVSECCKQNRAVML